MQTCTVCYYGQCLKCNDGFTLEINICISICGDGLVNKQEEECDNPNEQGCDNCQIQKGYLCSGQKYSICKTCGMYCEDCQNINKFDLKCNDCMPGYYPVLDKCLRCENNCITCKDQSNLCTSCYRNDCELCESFPGYYTDFQNKVCITQFGDGIIVQEREIVTMEIKKMEMVVILNVEKRIVGFVIWNNPIHAIQKLHFLQNIYNKYMDINLFNCVFLIK
ncbi:unnamed protein product [Paramecium sonneborni]|uniref:Uncharacterized protein n=1 Tax=Paramecium sonneborni TaxID=65129 RepID=A0A8S1RSX2_9CILI|nr:unnamed protein product [Paramecium sonneborni]